ncbi:alpha/beta hydrolase [Halobacterium salinarum]|uniref:alpha/beta hydrolase n=1 Tax=Halobacterium TaxID=2239 RepID=UPI001962D00E|nr:MULTISPECIES: alpha/beta hydrolase [Halobacterium]MCF2164729.1 alpha/beta hydrolase [Halobacterium salinarum]MCF2167592.1 alpha/beta hydrolase [Halobacterium salinarum]MCF2238809.1 alpha/beta hydrolase [Halobacterium salinarum]MDL0124577.1 alpha/beta hydrolase [Halobacterium salinarum]MDL0139606.1 alpha/beta hydrolase [Halobacterium salinarum]
MHQETVLVPGARDVEATLDEPADGDATACVVACPPHPQHRGHRGDDRLQAVAAALVEDGLACLRFDYGDWDGGMGEREDARNAIRWAGERYAHTAVFGFSFGGSIAALAAATTEHDLWAASLLAPTAELAAGLDAAAALTDVPAPVQVAYATRDTTADWEPVVEAARSDPETTVAELDADHFFVGKHGTVAATVGEFLIGHRRGR